MSKPELSVIIHVRKGQYGIFRNLMSLVIPYQESIEGKAYEVIIVGEDSTPPVKDTQIPDKYPDVRRISNKDSSSPAQSLNLGIQASRGNYCCFIINGNRLFTPGLLFTIINAINSVVNPVIVVHSFGLGLYPLSTTADVSSLLEKQDLLLKSISWPDNGYRLFEISHFSASSAGGWFSPVSYSPCLTVKREVALKLGGFNREFERQCGGYAEVDFLERACRSEDARLIYILGEGVFSQQPNHQLANDAQGLSKEFRDAYHLLKGGEYSLRPLPSNTLYLGTLPRQMNKSFYETAKRRWENTLRSRILPKPGDYIDKLYEAGLAVDGRQATPSGHLVLIGGQHRAGTSFVANALHHLGATLPEKVLGIHPNNLEGHFEPLAVVYLHDRLLSSFNNFWFSLKDLPQKWQDTSELKFYSLCFQGLLHVEGLLSQEEPHNKKTLLMKDPRFSLLMPLWDKIIETFSIQTSRILAFRHPSAVALSLNKRDGLDFEKGQMLWLRYMRNALNDWGDAVDFFYCHEAFVLDIETGLTQMAAQLGLQQDKIFAASKTYKAELICHSAQDLPPCQPDLQSIYNALRLHGSQAVPEVRNHVNWLWRRLSSLFL